MSTFARRKPTKTELTPDQRHEIENLWFVYGNHGSKFTMRNHRWIQNILERGVDYARFYEPSDECKAAVYAVLRK